MRAVIFITIVLCTVTAKSQEDAFYLIEGFTSDDIRDSDRPFVDSILTEYQKADSDTTRATLLAKLVEDVWDDHVWTAYNQYLLEWSSERIDAGLNSELQAWWQKMYANALSNRAYEIETQGDIQEAIPIYEEALEIQKELEDKRGMATTMNNLGLIYKNLGKVPLGLDYYKKALKLYEEVNSTMDIAMMHMNLGMALLEQKDYENAQKNMRKSIRLKIEAGDSYGLSYAYVAYGNSYSAQGEMDSAIYFMELADSVMKTVGDLKTQSVISGNLGTFHLIKGDTSKAFLYYNKQLKLAQVNSDQIRMSGALWNLAPLYAAKGDLDSALYSAEKSYEIAQEVGWPILIRNASSALTVVYEKLGRYQESLEMLKVYHRMGDSLYNEENKQRAIKTQFEYEFEKEALADSLEYQKMIAVKAQEQEAELQEERFKQYGLIGGLALVLLFAIFIFNRFRVTRSQKKVIEEQRDIVEEKNTEIMDSIHYAKRLQNAILPPVKLIEEHAADAFILYKPKDVVAGDFYWFEPTTDGFFIAAADCTGHGVPGAMVSVICNNALNKSVRELKLTRPSEILDSTRQLVIKEFEKSEHEVKDGMDIALVKVSNKLEGSTFTVEYAGANNPLWIARKDEGLEEVKADKQPIGKYAHNHPFSNHTLKLAKGEMVYIFSDGYADQFGGEKGKKFKAANMKKAFLQIHSLPCDEQEEFLDITMENWMGDLEQIDDICVIGLRI